MIFATEKRAKGRNGVEIRGMARLGRRRVLSSFSYFKSGDFSMTSVHFNVRGFGRYEELIKLFHTSIQGTSSEQHFITTLQIEKSC